MRTRYHFIANLHITETRSILFLTRYDKNNIIGWAKGHSKTGFSVNDWKFGKTLRKLKRISRWHLISDFLDFRFGWTFFKVRKLVSRWARSQSWLTQQSQTNGAWYKASLAIFHDKKNAVSYTPYAGRWLSDRHREVIFVVEKSFSGRWCCGEVTVVKMLK